MLKYLKLLTGASLTAIVLATWMANAVFYAQASRSVVYLGQQANIAVARHFNADVWARHADTLPLGKPAPVFKDDMQRFLYNAQALAVRVYSAQGALLYTTAPDMPPADFAAVRDKIQKSPLLVSSEFGTAEKIGLKEGEPSRRLVRTFIQLGSGAGATYLELITDVTESWSGFRHLQWYLLGGMVALFALLILAVLMVYHKSELIIARQHERNMELEAAAESALEENRQKSQFLASISHELRTPLNAIIGFSDIIKNEMETKIQDAKIRDYIMDIHNSGVHLLSLINDILDFSKAEAGKLELEIEETNATKLAGNCLRLVLPRAEAAQVELVMNLPKEPFVLETDGKKFKQVLLNLLSNAVKFTPIGGKVTIGGWADLAADAFVFQVIDTGIGIAQKDIAKAMAPFGQVDNALSRRYEGTGLGLPLTRKFIELMGGKFSIQSEANVGTTITFSLPRKFEDREGVIARRVG